MIEVYSILIEATIACNKKALDGQIYSLGK